MGHRKYLVQEKLSTSKKSKAVYVNKLSHIFSVLECPIFCRSRFANVHKTFLCSRKQKNV